MGYLLKYYFILYINCGILFALENIIFKMQNNHREYTFSHLCEANLRSRASYEKAIEILGEKEYIIKKIEVNSDRQCNINFITNMGNIIYVDNNKSQKLMYGIIPLDDKIISVIVDNDNFKNYHYYALQTELKNLISRLKMQMSLEK